MHVAVTYMGLVEMYVCRLFYQLSTVDAHTDVLKSIHGKII